MPKLKSRVRKLPSGSFQATFTWMNPAKAGDDKRERESKTFPTKKDADKWLADRDADRETGTLTTGTVGEWASAWLASHKATVAASTAQRDTQVIETYVRPHLGTVHLSKLDANRLNTFFAALKGKGASGDAISRTWQVLRKCLRSHSSLPNSRWEKVKVPGVRRPEMKTLTPDELKRLVTTAATWVDRFPYLEALVRVWVECCCRPREAIAIRRCDYAAGVISIRQSLCPVKGTPKPPKTPKSCRDVPLSKSAAAAVEKLLTVYPDDPADGPLFRAKCGRFGYISLPNWQKNVFNPLLKAAGIADATPYTLRHTGASVLLASGVSLVAVASRLGHADRSLVLRVYAHVMPDDQQKLTDVWGGLW